MQAQDTIISQTPAVQAGVSHPGFPAFTAHPDRSGVLGEFHARPFEGAAPPARFVRFVMLTEPGDVASIRRVVSEMADAAGSAAPAPDARYCRIQLSDALFRYEQHAEFASYTFIFVDSERRIMDVPASRLTVAMDRLAAFGKHLSSIDLHLELLPEAAEWSEGRIQPARTLAFDKATMATSRVEGGRAEVATDFRVASDGFLRYHVGVADMGEAEAGALAQRVLEYETYRAMALLGLPLAQRLSPNVRRMEEALVAIGQEMRQGSGLEANRQLLDRLTSVAAELETQAAQARFRFGASRAYFEIVRDRLSSFDEEQADRGATLGEMTDRRLGPAMRTCAALEARQTVLSERLSRAANLLRTRVDIELEENNRQVLLAISQASRAQLRLQQTVEGLSVAAISYYVVSLLSYLYRTLREAAVLPIDATLATGISVPVVVIFVWFVARKARRHFKE
jgi:uncharacterized membrane-anchored protein